VPVPFEPQTNEDHLDPSGLVDFVRAVNRTPDETFSREMATWLDLDRFLTYLAVENALAESDGFVGNQGMNNFYLYQYGDQRRFLFLPWDKDTALQKESVPAFSRVETNVLTRRLFVDPAVQQVYVAALRKAVTSFVNAGFLLPRLENAYTQIREAALLDTHKQYTNDEFELAVGGVRGIIAAREADVLSQTGGR
jgi:spore coat protein CotH